MKKILFVFVLMAMLFTIAADSAQVTCVFQSAEFVKPRQAVAHYKCWYWWDGVRYLKPTDLIHTFPEKFKLN